MTYFEKNKVQLSKYVTVTSDSLCSLHRAWKRLRPQFTWQNFD